MALPTFVALSQGETAIDGGPVTLPSGYVAGDTILICLGVSTGQEIVPPPGFQLIIEQVIGSGLSFLRVYRKVASGAEGATVTFGLTEGVTNSYVAVAYRGAAPSAYKVAGNTSGLSQVTSWTAPTYSAVVEEVAVAFIFAGSSGIAKDSSSNLRSPSLADLFVVLDRVTGPGTTSGSTLAMGSAQRSAAITVGLRPANSAPFAPTLNSMAAGEVVDVAITNRAHHTFNDPDSDLPRAEGQSKYEIRYRVVGNPTWTTLTPAPTSSQFHDFAGGTFTTDVDYERQVRTYDLAGAVGPWSASGFFTGGTAPAAPTITDPTVDEEIAFNSFDVAWTVTTQTSYQVRTVADDAGSPDPTEIYYDSGAVASSGDRTATVPFPVNNRTEHVQVRVWDGTLWSPWSSVRVAVAFVPPPTPTWELSVDPSTASLVITYETPEPVGDQPTPHHVDIWIDDGGDYVLEPKWWLMGLPIAGVGSHPTMRGGRDYEDNVRVIAYTVDGIPSE